MSLKEPNPAGLLQALRAVREHIAHGSGYIPAVLGVILVTLLAIALERWIKNYNLVLLYVLAVVSIGLVWGARPAMLASVLAFLGFNFFLTEPRFTFAVVRQDELTTLLILFLIALACGQAASRIRRQFILLTEANRSSKSLANLGHKLSLASDPASVWQALAEELADALRVDCHIAVKGEDTGWQLYPASLGSDHSSVLDQLFGSDLSGDGGEIGGESQSWRVFPITQAGADTVVALIGRDSRLGSAQQDLHAGDKELVIIMARHASDTWQRVVIAQELEAERLKNDMEQLRSALLASVSHDLKSPLVAMMGSAESLELLEGQLSSEDRHELLDTILRESRRLESYIQNLLDMTRLGHGGLKIERDWVPVGDIIGSAMKRLKRYLPGVQLEHRSTCAEQLLWVHGALVEQAIFNIMENAARFSPPDQAVLISTEICGTMCVITVEDRGPGIPVHLRELVFDMFYVVSEGDQRKTGTGMGLAISRGMIGAHGGTVTIADGSQGIGTRLVVQLPIPAPDRDAEPGSEERSPWAR